MKVIFFTKFLRSMGPEEIAKAVKGLGFDGLDLAIRGGYCVNPSNVREMLPDAMAIWQEQGLSVPLATLEGNATDPDRPDVQAIYEACGRAGIPFIKLGYWGWSPRLRYWDGVGFIREALARFQQLGERHGVCSLVHTHSGNCFGVNASAAMHLVHDLDPRYVGVYLDPAHLALDGEPLAMAVDIARDYLRVVGVKNARYEGPIATGARWRPTWTLLDEGLVDWGGAIRLLREAGYDGPLSLHGEYSASEETRRVLELVAKDMPYLRRQL